MKQIRLPIDQVLPQLVEGLRHQPVMVLEAAPGAGKTTRAPLALLGADWLAGQKILLLEPRRLAARTAAEFMARQRGEKVGETIGYRIRYQHRVSSQTRVEVITEGILTRRLQADPELSGVGLVIFDEFHERSIHSDLALALTNDLRQGLREDLRILVMSATLDSDPLLKLLGARRLRAEGRNWPVDLIYLGGEIAFDCVAPMQVAINRAIRETRGDILAFLPGVREIEQLKTLLQPGHPQLQICRLHGQLNQTEQQLALQKATGRKLVLATNIAETSLTIDGISTLVDSGLCRQSTFDPGSGLSRLLTTRISQASSTQRAGRAGRQGPGVCYRLWGEAFQASLLPQTPPEIRSADLTPLALALRSWGIQDATQLNWLDPPPSGALAAANQLLHLLQLTDHRGRLNPDGQRAATWPIHPRLARLLLQAEHLEVMPVGCLLAAFIAESRTSTGPGEEDLQTDIRLFLQNLQQGKNHFQPAKQAFRQLKEIFGTRTPDPNELQSDILADLLAAAYPDRVACSRQSNGDYLLANNRGARLKPQSPLRNHKWLVITDLNQNQKGETIIRRAVPLGKPWLLEKINTAKWDSEVFWDEKKQRVQAHRVKRFGAVELCTEKQGVLPEQAQQIICSLIRTGDCSLLNWSPEADQFIARVNLLHRYLGSPWPQVSRNDLQQHPEDWLAPFLSGINSAIQLKKLVLLPALKSLLDWQLSSQLDKLAPSRIKVPSGEMMKIDYLPEEPVLAVKLQQLFGLADTPAICQGKVPLTLHLLSPAGRPLAVTSDLKNFWNNIYPEVKKEMKGRYPKHPWPNDPWQAIPTRRTTRGQTCRGN